MNWQLIQALDVNHGRRIDLSSQSTARRINDLAESVWRTQRLQSLQTHPWVHSQPVLPEVLQGVVERVLFRYVKTSNGLPWVLLRVPNFTSVLNWLVFEVLTELDLEEILWEGQSVSKLGMESHANLGIMLFVEVLQPAVKNVRTIFWLDGLVIELPLGLRVRN